MPRFPDYVAQNDLAVAPAPQIQANTAVGKSLASLGYTVEQVGQRWMERQRQQTDFDDQVAFQRYSLAQDQALQQAGAAMPPQATGFHAGFMADRAQADDAFLQTVSPGNRDRYAGLIAIGRDRASLAAARMEFAGRGAYEQAAFGQSAADMADQVRGNPNLLPYALDALKAQQANQSSVLPAARDAQWLATKQALQLAGWQGRYGNDPAGQGLAALGVKLSPADQAALPLLTDEGPVDPSLDALTPAQRQQLLLQAQTNRAQSQAAAKADLAGLRQRLGDTVFTGRLDGPPPDRQTFVTAHGPDEGAQRFDDANAFLKDAPAVTALLYQPDSAQDAALAHYAVATDADGQRFYRNATAAVARYRADRAADPVGTLGKLYPALAQQWAALQGADPSTLRQALPGLVNQTAALADATGVPAGQRRYLPNSIASTIVQAFSDTSRPMAERIGPLRDTIAAVRDPAQRYALFRQLVGSGIPRLLEPAVAAYARGDNAAAGRLFAAVTPDPAQNDDTGAAAPASPVALGNAAITPAPARSGAGADIDLSESAASELARTTGIDPSPIAQALFPRLVRNNLSTNGGDLPAATALAAADLRKPGGDTDPVRYAFLAPTKGGPRSFGTVAPTPQAPPVPDVPAAPPATSREALLGKNGKPPPSANRLNYFGMPEEPLDHMPFSEFVSRFVKKGGLAGAADIVAAGFYADAIRPTDMSEPYPGTFIPKSYSLGSFDGTDVSPAVSRYIWNKTQKAPPDGLDPDIAADIRAQSFGDFNFAIVDALRTLHFDNDPNKYRKTISGGSFEFRFAPSPASGGKPTVVAVREAPSPERSGQPGPWWGDPDAAQQPQQSASRPIGPATTASTTTPAATADDPPTPQPALLPAGHGTDDPYDKAEYDAAHNAGLSPEAALVQAKNNYRGPGLPQNNSKNKTGTFTSSQPDNSSVSGPQGPDPSSSEVVVRLKYRAHWSEEERLAADAKIKALNETDTVKTKPNRSKKSLKKEYIERNGPIPDEHELDHTKDLQLGGKHLISNIGTLFSSINRSLGPQIYHQIKHLPYGTIIDRFEIH